MTPIPGRRAEPQLERPILMSYGSANRDEDVIPETDRYDMVRAKARERLAFGGGIHGVEPPERLTTVWFDAIQKRQVEFTPT